MSLVVSLLLAEGVVRWLAPGEYGPPGIYTSDGRVVPLSEIAHYLRYAGEQDRCKGEIRIARGVRRPELDALGFRIGASGRDTNACTTVVRGIDEIDWRLIARYKATIRIGGGCAKGAEGRRVMEDATNAKSPKIAQVSIFARLVEQITSLFPEAHVDVHA